MTEDINFSNLSLECPHHPFYDAPTIPNILFAEAPPLDSIWLAYEKENGLLDTPSPLDCISTQEKENGLLDTPSPPDCISTHEKENGLLDTPSPPDCIPTSHDALKLRQQSYAKACRERNDRMMSASGRDHSLLEGIKSVSTSVKASDGFEIPIRLYTPTNNMFPQDLVVYYHGGGLCVGDLDSEDVQCRRICTEAGIRVMSVEYRLMPDYSPDTALSDAWDAYLAIDQKRQINPCLPPGNVFLVGSSSGGQLAAQVSQLARKAGYRVDGLVLRCPVTVDASLDGAPIPERFRRRHTSYCPSFETSLLRIDRKDFLPKTRNLPLNAASFEGLPRTFIQLCTNDIYYSDGACYYEALLEAGNEVTIEILEGWPHTFWLKAPELEEALEADRNMIGWLKFLILAKVWERSDQSDLDLVEVLKSTKQ